MRLRVARATRNNSGGFPWRIPNAVRNADLGHGQPAGCPQDRLQKLVKAGVGELRLRFDAADGQYSIAAAACLPDGSVEEGGLPDACFADYQQRSPVLSRSCEGGLELCDLSVPSSQPDHPVRVRVPGVYVIRAAPSTPTWVRRGGRLPGIPLARCRCAGGRPLEQMPARPGP